MKSSKGGRNSVPNTVVAERREYEVMMRNAGMSIATITQQVNTQAATRNWGTVSSRTVAKDIADYFRVNRVLKIQDYDHADQMRESLLSQIEINMEKLSLHIASKDKGKKLYDINGVLVESGSWKPFEKQDALEKLHKMQMNYAEVQNWNLGRQNININIQQNNLNMVYDNAAIDFKNTKPTVFKEFVSDLRKVRDKMELEEKALGLCQ